MAYQLAIQLIFLLPFLMSVLLTSEVKGDDYPFSAKNFCSTMPVQGKRYRYGDDCRGYYDCGKTTPGSYFIQTCDGYKIFNTATQECEAKTQKTMCTPNPKPLIPQSPPPSLSATHSLWKGAPSPLRTSSFDSNPPHDQAFFHPDFARPQPSINSPLRRTNSQNFNNARGAPGMGSLDANRKFFNDDMDFFNDHMGSLRESDSLHNGADSLRNRADSLRNRADSLRNGADWPTSPRGMGSLRASDSLRAGAGEPTSTRRRRASMHF